MLAAASITLESRVAVITPGTGVLPSIPEAARAIAIDVQALPETSDARAAVDRVLGAVLRGDVALPSIEERTCNGQPDEVNRFVAQDAEQFACKTHVREQHVKGAGVGRPLAILTGPRLTPLAAWVAVAMRASVGALVVGENVPTALAESRWIGIGTAGVTIRTGRLIGSDGAPLPDVIIADYRSVDARASIRDVDWAAPRPSPRGAATRSALSSLERPSDWSIPSARVGDGRAALIVAYAATRTFFPYLDEIGDGLDARLDEALAIIEKGPQADRSIVRKALRRFAEVLHDGHAWVFDDRKLALWGSPAALLPARDAMVVAVSSTLEVKPGDTVLAIGGTPVATLMDEWIRYSSGSPHAVRAGVAERMAQTDVPISIRHPSGAVETVTIPHGSPVSTTDRMFERAAGPLHDLGAPDVYYLTLDASSPHGPNERNLPAIKAAIAGKRGLILDMRGYPSRAAWSVLAYVASQASRGPQMAELVVTPSSRALGPFFAPQDLTIWTSEVHGYEGPVIVLTGAKTQSQAEHWLSFFRSENRGKLVGGQTSGANGTITGVQLPGGYGLTFTGMFVRHPDGSRFHAIGHVPDIEIEPTIADLQQRRDTVLLRALAELNREHPRSLNTAR